MKQKLKKILLLGMTLGTVSCGTLEPMAPEKPTTQNNDLSERPTGVRGTVAFQRTAEYKMLRTKLLNAWEPFGKKTEGFYPYIYRCSSGSPTIGFGTNLNGCGMSLSQIPMYKKNGQRLTVSEIKSWINQTSGLGKAQCRALATRLGYTGISRQDAQKISFQEAAQKVDLLHKDMIARHGMELFDQPFPIQILILDLAYQRGQNGVFAQKNLWPCLKNKDYAHAHQFVTCCGNVARNKGKKNLVLLTQAYKQHQDITPYLKALHDLNIHIHPFDLEHKSTISTNIDYRKRTPSVNPRHTFSRSGAKRS